MNMKALVIEKCYIISVFILSTNKFAYHVDVSVLKRPVNSSTSVHCKNVKQVLVCIQTKGMITNL